MVLPGLATTDEPSLKVPTFPDPYCVFISFTLVGLGLKKSIAQVHAILCYKITVLVWLVVQE